MQISRVNRPKSAAKRSYDRMSSMYEWLAGSSEEPFMRIGLGMLDVQPGEEVLEIGSGTGKALIELCKLVGENGFVCGLDLSTGMLKVAHDNLLKAGLANRTHLLCADGMLVPLTSSTFSAIFMSFSLELFDTPEIFIVLAECWRLLKTGGRITVVSMQKPEHSSQIVRLYEWFHEKLPNYVDCRPIYAGDSLQAAKFVIEQQQLKSMWGLPVALLLARKCQE
jgi:ubiquinone/menaquinone biosynthesis C-methylase UbiE